VNVEEYNNVLRLWLSRVLATTHVLCVVTRQWIWRTNGSS